jgi:hypothetical protein
MNFSTLFLALFIELCLAIVDDCLKGNELRWLFNRVTICWAATIDKRQGLNRMDKR